VWFGTVNPDCELVVGEGIESSMSAARLYHAAASVAALSAVGIRNLILPPEAKLVRVFADHDPDGKGVAAATAACRRWREEGRAVVVVQAREAGGDANDLWQRRIEGRIND
jgi:hypothetical protein